jgi:hypothetical protein
MGQEGSVVRAENREADSRKLNAESHPPNSTADAPP